MFDCKQIDLLILSKSMKSFLLNKLPENRDSPKSCQIKSLVS